MRLSEQQKVIIQDYFKDKPVLKAYVFGSYARGDADEKSDIDLLIDWDYANLKGLDAIGYELELKEALNKEIDLVSQKWMSPYIAKYVERDKVLVYAK